VLGGAWTRADLYRDTRVPKRKCMKTKARRRKQEEALGATTALRIDAVKCRGSTAPVTLLVAAPDQSAAAASDGNPVTRLCSMILTASAIAHNFFFAVINCTQSHHSTTLSSKLPVFQHA